MLKGVHDGKAREAIFGGISAADGWPGAIGSKPRGTGTRVHAAKGRARDPVKSRGLVRSGDREEVERIFTFVSANQALFSIRAMCRVLEVSASGYYAWRKRKRSARAREDEKLQQRIEAIHRHSRQTYGVPRIHAELQQEGTKVGRKRIARLMKSSALAGVSRRQSTVATRRDRSARPAPDLVDR